MKKGFSAVLIVGLIFLIPLVLDFLNSKHIIKMAGHSNARQFKNTPFEYVRLFKPQYAKYRQTGICFDIPDRNPIIGLSFKELPYLFSIVICKLNLSTDKPLTDIISEKDTSVFLTDYDAYNTYYAPYHFKYSNDTPYGIQNIFLTLHGQSLTTLMKNDSVLYYSINLANLSIKYKPDARPDIYINTHNHTATADKQFEIMFLKRKNIVYMFVMCDLFFNQYPAGSLYDLINI